MAEAVEAAQPVERVRVLVDYWNLQLGASEKLRAGRAPSMSSRKSGSPSGAAQRGRPSSRSCPRKQISCAMIIGRPCRVSDAGR